MGAAADRTSTWPKVHPKATATRPGAWRAEPPPCRRSAR